MPFIQDVQNKPLYDWHFDIAILCESVILQLQME